jgi:hypothetical protein
MGQEPFVLFGRRKPASYWDDFAVDLLPILLPVLLMLLSLGAATERGALHLEAFAGSGEIVWLLISLPLLGLEVGSLIKTWRM